MTRYLIDNSVWARVSRHASVEDKVLGLLARGDRVMTCPPQVLEVCHRARNPREHDELRRNMLAFDQSEAAPHEEIVLRIQGNLWRAGLIRAVGALDVLIAAYAMVNDAVLLHYDRDFEHIRRVEPDFRHEWVAMRGSLAN